MRSRTGLPVIDTELPIRPDASSCGRPWAGITIQIHHWRTAGSTVSPELDHDILAMRYRGHANLEQRRLGRVHRGIVVPGNLGLHPRGVESRWQWDRPGAIVVSRIPQCLLREAAESAIRESRTEYVLRNCFGARDPFVESILRTLAGEVQAPPHPVQPLVAESLSCALAAHLVHRFNAEPAHAAARPAGLHPQALARVLDYMHGTPDAVTLGELAAIAQVSRFHFARMFRLSMGETPMAYLERLRLLRARELLRSGEHPLARVAQLTGFADQSHFGRRFRRHFGCTPGDYARGRGAGRAG